MDIVKMPSKYMYTSTCVPADFTYVGLLKFVHIFCLIAQRFLKQLPKTRQNCVCECMYVSCCIYVCVYMYMFKRKMYGKYKYEHANMRLAINFVSL